MPWQNLLVGARKGPGRRTGASPARRWLIYGAVVVLAVALGWGVERAVTAGRRHALSFGDTAHASVADVTVLGWQLVPVPPSTPAGPQVPATPSVPGLEATPAPLPGHVVSAVPFLSCRNSPGGTKADLSRFRLEMPDGTELRSAGGDARTVGQSCATGSVLFQTPEATRPTYVLYQSTPAFRWAVPAA